MVKQLCGSLLFVSGLALILFFLIVAPFQAFMYHFLGLLSAWPGYLAATIIAVIVVAVGLSLMWIGRKLWKSGDGTARFG
jgi:hypothetical protein